MSALQPEPSAATGAPPAEAWNRALEAELGELRRYARRLARDADEAEDLVQDVMERALRYRHAFDGASAPGPWLRRIALRAFFDRREREAREPARLGEAAEAVAERRGTDARDERAELERVLAPLSEPERAALVGFHARGETLEELCARLGLPMGTLKSHLHRARRKLADRWGRR